MHDISTHQFVQPMLNALYVPKSFVMVNKVRELGWGCHQIVHSRARDRYLLFETWNTTLNIEVLVNQPYGRDGKSSLYAVFVVSEITNCAFNHEILTLRRRIEIPVSQNFFCAYWDRDFLRKNVTEWLDWKLRPKLRDSLTHLWWPKLRDSLTHWHIHDEIWTAERGSLCQFTRKYKGRDREIGSLYNRRFVVSGFVVSRVDCITSYEKAMSQSNPKKLF